MNPPKILRGKLTIGAKAVAVPASLNAEDRVYPIAVEA